MEGKPSGMEGGDTDMMRSPKTKTLHLVDGEEITVLALRRIPIDDFIAGVANPETYTTAHRVYDELLDLGLSNDTARKCSTGRADQLFKDVDEATAKRMFSYSHEFYSIYEYVEKKKIWLVKEYMPKSSIVKISINGWLITEHTGDSDE